MSNGYVMYDNVIPLLSPLDTAATALASPYVAMAQAHDLAFLIHFGSITSTSADEYCTVTVEATTSAASAATEVTIPFTYRKSGAVGANTWGAATTATTAGVQMLTASEDDMLLYIFIDPAAVLADQADATHVRVVVTPTEGVVSLFSAIAIVNGRYHQTTHISAT